MPAQKPPERTTTTISPVCLKCGTIAKSGKTSCCGRGGSWFNNCGRAGNANLRHTWYEGIHACKARSQTGIIIGQQESAAQQKGIESSRVDSKVNSKGVITGAALMVATTSNITTDSTSASTSSAYVIPTSQGCEKLTNIATHFNLLVTIAFQYCFC